MLLFIHDIINIFQFEYLIGIMKKHKCARDNCRLYLHNIRVVRYHGFVQGILATMDAFRALVHCNVHELRTGTWCHAFIHVSTYLYSMVFCNVKHVHSIARLPAHSGIDESTNEYIQYCIQIFVILTQMTTKTVYIPSILRLSHNTISGYFQSFLSFSIHFVLTRCEV